MDKKLLYAFVPVVLLVCIIAVFYSSPSGRREASFPLEVEDVRYEFPWLNVTFLATGDVSESVDGFEVYYEGEKIASSVGGRVITMYEGDSCTVNIYFDHEPLKDAKFEIKLFIGEKYYQKFEVTIP